MITEALKYLERSFAKGAAIQTHEHKGLTYADRALTRLSDELPVATIPPLEVSTLAALVAYVVDDFDEKGETSGLFVHVVSPTRVDVLTPLQGEGEVRQRILSAQARVPRLMLSEIDAPRWLDVGDMGVHLRTCFLKSEARDSIVKFIGSWVETDKLEVSDDGFGQQVVVRSGLGMVAAGGAPSDMDLAPIRTFHEVEQPVSPFVLRLRKGGHVALFSADGGAWENEAIQSVAEFLEERLPDVVTILS
jgi:hypothetical protein